MYVCVYIYIYIHVCVCIYMCMYIYIYIYIWAYCGFAVRLNMGFETLDLKVLRIEIMRTDRRLSTSYLCMRVHEYVYMCLSV